MKNQERFVITHNAVVKKGRLDGRDYKITFWPFRKPKTPYPMPDQTKTAQFESELTDAANSDLQGLARDWKEADEKLKPAYGKATITLANARHDHRKAVDIADAVRKIYEEIHKAYVDYVLPALNPFWMHLWLMFVGASEFIFNSVAFEIFGQRHWETLAIAAGIGIAFPIFSHQIGQNLKQKNRNRKDNILAGVWTGLVTLGLVALAIVRKQFFDAQNPERLFGISLSPAESTVIFITMNLLLVGCGILVSYRGSYENQEEYNTLRKRHKKAAEDLKNAEAVERAAKQHLESAEIAHNNIRQQREKTFEQFVEQATRLIRNNDWFIRVYRTANMESRLDSVTPPCFDVDPVVADMPEALQELDWDIDYGHQSTLLQLTENGQRLHPKKSAPAHAGNGEVTLHEPDGSSESLSHIPTNGEQP